jgi:hypothetical protein
MGLWSEKFGRVTALQIIYVTDAWMRYAHTDIIYDEIPKMVKILRGTIGLWNDVFWS